MITPQFTAFSRCNLPIRNRLGYSNLSDRGRIYEDRRMSRPGRPSTLDVLFRHSHPTLNDCQICLAEIRMLYYPI